MNTEDFPAVRFLSLSGPGVGCGSNLFMHAQGGKWRKNFNTHIGHLTSLYVAAAVIGKVETNPHEDETEAVAAKRCGHKNHAIDTMTWQLWKKYPPFT